MPPPAPPRAPPAAAPAIAFICGSRSHKMALREETRPRRQPRPASGAPRPERAADTPPVAHSPETRLSGAASVTAPGASGEKGRGKAGPACWSLRARRGSGTPPPHRHGPRRLAPAPWGAQRAQPGWGGKRPERRAGLRGRRSPARHLGTAAAAGHARRGHLRLQRGLGGGIRADELVIGSSLYVAPHGMLPRAVPGRGDRSFTPKRPSF